MYKVIIEKGFKDLEDNNFIYKYNDIYPREGTEPNKKRIKELLSTNNKIGEILIEEIDEKKEIDNTVETEVPEDEKKETDNTVETEVPEDEKKETDNAVKKKISKDEKK